MSTPCPCCGSTLVSGSISARSLDAIMVFDSDHPFRPLGFLKRGGEQSLENLADCDNTRYLFGYEPGFKGKKYRKIIIVDVDE